MKKLTVLILCEAILFTSCMTTTQLGRNIEYMNNNTVTTTYLRETYGAPHQIIDNAEAGEIWIYTQRYNVSQPGVITPFGGSVFYTAPSNYDTEEYLKFWVRPNKTVSRWETTMPTKVVDHGKTAIATLVGCAVCALLFGLLLSSGTP